MKISTSKGRNQRRLILDGKLVAPWTHVMKSECEKARADHDECELVIFLKNITTNSQQGEDLLLELMKGGARFRCCGVFTKQCFAAGLEDSVSTTSVFRELSIPGRSGPS